MKRLLIPFIKTIILVLLIQGCQKYEDGPSFTILSKKARLSNKWVTNEILVDDVPLNLGHSLILNYQEFFKDGSYSININEDSVSTKTIFGTWDFLNDKEYIYIKKPAYTYWNNSVSVAASARTYKILRLTNKELWLFQENNSTVETRYVPY